MKKTRKNKKIGGLFGIGNIFKNRTTSTMSNVETINEDLSSFNVDVIKEMMGFVKEIDGIVFCAVSFVNSNEVERSPYNYDEYEKICLVSTIPEKNGIKERFFWAYQSTSELGMWRLCGGKISSKGDFVYDKLMYVDYGDYLQTTFLHIELQKYINEIIKTPSLFEKLIGVTERFKRLNGINNPLYGLSRFIEIYNERENYITSCSNFSKQMFKIIDPRKREIHSYPFNLFSDNQQCNHHNPETLILFSDEFEMNYEVISISTIYENYEYNKGIDNPRRGEIRNISILGDIKEFILRKKILEGGPEIDPRVNLIKLIFLETKNINITTKTFFGNKIQPIMNSNQILTENGLPFRNKKYYMPIGLIPIIEGTAECTFYGVYSHYIRAGSYVCKLFDYVNQCTTDEKRRTKCLRKYIFVGDRYDNLFPFKINEPPSIIPTTSITQKEEIIGGKKRKNRNIQRQKTRKHKKK